ncbi:glucosaminidase domain-containing protein [Chitinophaga sp. CC14]|uniref:glucosaminidase domain-containing protein n=1 Tax=Chitinophaga sp. CC14 TaxID=3029199 RepID=UPI003B776F85
MNANDKISIFIKLNFPAAITCWRDTGIPTLFMLAQKGLESGWGDHAPQFNSSGMTPGPAWKGRTQLLRTEEDFPDNNRQLHKFPEVISITAYTKDGKTRYKWVVRRLFRAYDSAAEAWTDYGRFLKEQKRYASAFNFSDPRKFADAIAAAGYATGPKYAEELKKCITSVENRLPILNLTLPV